jgi:hypothetical protein
LGGGHGEFVNVADEPMLGGWGCITQPPYFKTKKFVNHTICSVHAQRLWHLLSCLLIDKFNLGGFLGLLPFLVFQNANIYINKKTI